jgi:hypothetical protein
MDCKSICADAVASGFSGSIEAGGVIPNSGVPQPGTMVLFGTALFGPGLNQRQWATLTA